MGEDGEELTGKSKHLLPLPSREMLDPLVAWPSLAERRHYADMSRRVVDALLFVGLIVIYVLAARLGLSLDAGRRLRVARLAFDGDLACRAPPARRAVLARHLARRPHHQSAVGAPLLVALMIGCGNTAKALIGVVLLRRVVRLHRHAREHSQRRRRSSCSAPSSARSSVRRSAPRRSTRAHHPGRTVQQGLEHMVDR